MSKNIVKILDITPVTHNVKQFKLEKPSGFSFIPGQAADVSINLPEWKDNIHPFTFTGLNEWNYLQFTIKIYPERKGVTDMLGKLKVGDELIIGDVFGAIHYKGTGVFIAGGAGITPFIAIFRDLHSKGKLKGNQLIFSNKTPADIILKDELTNMLGSNFINVLTHDNAEGNGKKRIDKSFLTQHINDFSQHFYICGPDEFVRSISDTLTALGAKPDEVIFEK